MDPAKRPSRRHRYKTNRSTFVFDDDLLREVEREARRLDRSVSWVVRRAWATALHRIRDLQPGDSDER